MNPGCFVKNTIKYHQPIELQDFRSNVYLFFLFFVSPRIVSCFDKNVQL